MADVHISGGFPPDRRRCGAIQGHSPGGGDPAEMVAEAAQWICPAPSLHPGVLGAKRHLP